MPRFKIGDYVAVRSLEQGAEVVWVDGGNVTVRIVTFDETRGRQTVRNETYGENELEPLKRSHGIIIF